MSTAAIITGTRYPDLEHDRVQQVRFALAKELAENARQLGLPLFLIEASSAYPQVAEELAARGATILTPDDSPEMGPCRAQCAEAALADPRQFDYFLWTEPEKASMPGFLERLVATAEEGYGVVMSARSGEGFESHPDYMWQSEVLANWKLGLLTGHFVDWYMGPKLMDRQATQIFADYYRQPEVGWAGVMNSTLIALKQGLRLGSVLLPEYRYPASQAEAEAGDEKMKEKRRQQHGQIVAEMTKVWNTPA